MKTPPTETVLADLRANPPQRGLSLWQPWASYVACGLKPIENRTWHSPSAVGSWIAIHAAKRVDKSVLEKLRFLTGIEPDVARLGGVIGVAKLVDIIPEGNRSHALPEDLARWYQGPYGWKFDHAIELDDMIQCRGHQSLFYLTDEVRQSLAQQLGI